MKKTYLVALVFALSWTITGYAAEGEDSLLKDAQAAFKPIPDKAPVIQGNEATLAGCALLLTRAVGASADLLNAKNGVAVRTNSAEALESALREMAAWNEARFIEASDESLSLADRFGPRRFVSAFHDIVSRVCPA